MFNNIIFIANIIVCYFFSFKWFKAYLSFQSLLFYSYFLNKNAPFSLDPITFLKRLRDNLFFCKDLLRANNTTEKWDVAIAATISNKPIVMSKSMESLDQWLMAVMSAQSTWKDFGVNMRVHQINQISWKSNKAFFRL